MSLITVNKNPDKKLLNSFGIIALLASVCISLLLYLVKGLAIEKALIVFLLGLVIFICSRTSPKLIRLIYLGLTYATLPIGFAVSFVVLAVFYFLILTPLALFFRLIGRDLLGLRFNTQAKTYWTKRSESATLERYFRQF